MIHYPNLVVSLVIAAGSFGCGAPLPGSPRQFLHPLDIRLQPASGPRDPKYAELAFRDGDQPWQLLDPSRELIRVEVTDPFGRYGVARVWEDGTHRSADAYFETLDEDALLDYSYSTVEPTSPPANARLLLTPAQQQWASVSVAFGDQIQWLTWTSAGAVANFRAGTADLLVGLWSGFDSPARVLVRRDFAMDANPTTPLDLSQAVELRALPLQLIGAALPGELLSISTLVQPASVRTPSTSWSSLRLSDQAATVATAQLQVLPEPLALPGDQYLGVASFSSAQGQRNVTWRLDPGLQPETIEPPAPNPERLTLGADGRPLWQWTRSEPDAWFDMATSMRLPESLVLHTSPGWLRGRTEATIGDTSATPLLQAISMRTASQLGEHFFRESMGCAGRDAWCDLVSW